MYNLYIYLFSDIKYIFLMCNTIKLVCVSQTPVCYIGATVLVL